MVLPTTLLICMIILSTAAWSPGLHITSSQILSSRRCTHLMMMADDDEDIKSDAKHSGYNVLGTELSCCCSNVGGSGIGTGFYRNGYCGRCMLIYRTNHAVMCILSCSDVYLTTSVSLCTQYSNG